MRRRIRIRGRRSLVMMDPMLREGLDYPELGPDDLDRLDPHGLTRYLVKRLESLGHSETRDAELPPQAPSDYDPALRGP